MLFVRRDRGVALLLSLAILAVLAVLATTFTRLMIVEHAASSNYVAASRARALANTGIEYALGKLRHLARNTHHSRFEDHWMYKLRIYDSSAAADLHETSGAGLPIEYAIYPPTAKDETEYPFSSGAQIYGGISWYKGNTGVPKEADPIVATYPVADKVEEIYNPEHFAKKTGRPVSGWVGSHLGGTGFAGPRDRYVAGTEEAWGDTFARKVLDTASQININTQEGTTEANGFSSPMLKQFLNNLGVEVDNFFRSRFTGKSGGVKSWNKYELAQFGYRYIGFHSFKSAKFASGGKSHGNKLGDWLITVRNKRPGGVFQSKEEILSMFNELYPSDALVSVGGLRLPGNQVALEEYNKLKDFITLYGYRDRTVIEPGTLMTAQQWEVRDPKKAFLGARSPINMNTVSNPVLVAWLRGIAYERWEMGAYKKDVSFSSKFSLGGLRKLARLFRKVTARDPILGWKGLEALLHPVTHLVSPGAGLPKVVCPRQVPGQSGGMAAPYKADFQAELESMGFDEWDRDAFLAMADPNATLNKFNPDLLIRRLVDKYDLRHWTTEMCFNSMGYYEITALGTITEVGGQVRAQSKIRSVYQVFDQVIRTTQRDFELSRELDGIDVKTGKSVKLWDEDFWGVLSYPEFRNKIRDYKEVPLPDKNALTSLDATRYGYVALYDGMLSFNSLARVNSYPKDFLAGFNYPRGSHPATKSKTTVDGFKPKGSSSNQKKVGSYIRSYPVTVAGKAQRHPMVKAGTDNAKSEKDLGGSRLERFNSGSDAFPMGVYMDKLRGRTLAYDAKAAVQEGVIGSVEFWVKPRFVNSIGKETWFYWQDDDTKKIQYIWCYREGTNVIVDFSIGNSLGGKLLKFDGAFWKPGSWHHIHVDWGDTGRLFVDGDVADQGGIRDDRWEAGKSAHPLARHMDFGGWPPKTQKFMNTWTLDPGKYTSQISWVNKHIPKKPAKYSKSGSKEFQIGGRTGLGTTTAANATIDNITSTTWRIFGPDTKTFMKEDIPKRYFPREYRGYSRMFWQSITSEFKRYGRDISLGTMAASTHDGTESLIKLYVRMGTDAAEGAPGARDGVPLKDVMGGGGTLSWDPVAKKHLDMRWGAEFMTMSINTPSDEATHGDYFDGGQETSFLQDFTLTYLLPSPQQMERREIDF